MSNDSDKFEHRRDWFAVERRVFDDPMFGGKYDRRSAWLWLIANAAKKEHHVRTRAGVMLLKRGEVIVAREFLAATWGWTPSEVRTYLGQLSAAERLELRQSNGHLPNVARVSNYGRFQDISPPSSPVKSPVDRQSVASGSPHPYKEHLTGEDKTAAPKVSGKVDRVVVEAALADFNTAAEKIGFSRCTTLTDQRAKALAKRLADLGQGDLARGEVRFREALSAIPHDAFLSGKAKPRAGDKPFRLDLERLLSTGGKMSDVLGKLCDMHDDRGPANVAEARPAPKRDAVADIWREAQAEELAAQRARRNGHDTGGDHADLH